MGVSRTGLTYPQPGLVDLRIFEGSTKLYYGPNSRCHTDLQRVHMYEKKVRVEPLSPPSTTYICSVIMFGTTYICSVHFQLTFHFFLIDETNHKGRPIPTTVEVECHWVKPYDPRTRFVEGVSEEINILLVEV